MFETVTPTIDYQMISENYGHFVIEPLEPGYGLTIGNALRRVLLSSLTGASVTSVRIEGVQHEFSTLPNIKEDTLEFLLNVKGIRFRYLSERSDTITLEVEGEGEVKAGDIKQSATFEIVNPEHHLATIDSPNGKLSVEFTVEIGRGYVTAGSNEGRPIGVLPVDSVFTPIRRANYRVEKTRVEERSDYDRLILDIWTDGTISPDTAVAESAWILIQQFSNLANFGKPSKQMLPVEEEMQYPSSQKDEIPLEQLGLSSRTLNALRRGGINSVNSLLDKSKDELLGLKNFGIKSWREVQEKLIESGFIERPEDFIAEEEESEVSPEELSEVERAREEMMKKLGEKFTVRGDI
ncbi:MAG: DNA-directed RNA polymerase subunit alpha [Dehalococcoidia bacterium]